MSEKIEQLLQKPYWIIDILPYQVPFEGAGQYFTVDKYFLRDENMAAVKQKHINLILKLNCYYDIALDEEEPNPPVEHLVEVMKQRYVNILVKDALIVSEADDTHMTIFNPDEELLELVRQLAWSEGLFVWRP